jgi:hypothetical protein
VSVRACAATSRFSFAFSSSNKSASAASTSSVDAGRCNVRCLSTHHRSQQPIGRTRWSCGPHTVPCPPTLPALANGSRHARTHACIHAYTHARTHARTHTHTLTHARTSIDRNTYAHTNTDTDRQTDTDTDTDTHTVRARARWVVPPAGPTCTVVEDERVDEPRDEPVLPALDPVCRVRTSRLGAPLNHPRSSPMALVTKYRGGADGSRLPSGSAPAAALWSVRRRACAVRGARTQASHAGVRCNVAASGRSGVSANP